MKRAVIVNGIVSAVIFVLMFFKQQLVKTI